MDVVVCVVDISEVCFRIICLGVSVCVFHRHGFFWQIRRSSIIVSVFMQFYRLHHELSPHLKPVIKFDFRTIISQFPRCGGRCSSAFPG